jgi:hypothetical protein
MLSKGLVRQRSGRSGGELAGNMASMAWHGKGREGGMGGLDRRAEMSWQVSDGMDSWQNYGV